MRTDPETSGKAHFTQLYRSELAEEARWLEYGAALKGNSVEFLLARNGILPESLLELGCGTGAVVRECQRRSIAGAYTGVDYSPEALDYLAAHSTGIRTFRADITADGFTLDGHYDVVLLSHVLEHLEEPLRALRNALHRTRCGYIIAEVPLEDLPASRLKNLFRDRRRNSAGHVQFFTRASFRALMRATPLTILDERSYVPILPAEGYDLVQERAGLSPLSAWLKSVSARYVARVLGPLWRRLYYAHYAVLCRPTNALTS